MPNLASETRGEVLQATKEKQGLHALIQLFVASQIQYPCEIYPVNSFAIVVYI